MIFEGEYKNNLKNGKGKEYHPNGKLKFEGGYLNGQKDGQGKEYDTNGEFLRDITYADF
jgi:antitoxin component YwqK of YwqJK toxin-antitoxin module